MSWKEIETAKGRVTCRVSMKTGEVMGWSMFIPWAKGAWERAFAPDHISNRYPLLPDGDME